MPQHHRAAPSGPSSSKPAAEAPWHERDAFRAPATGAPAGVPFSRAARRADDLLAERLGSADLDLPPFPQQVFALIELLRDANVDVAIVEEHLRNEPAMAAEVLRFANSGLYAPSSRISDLKHAVGFLGFRRLRSLALGIGVKVAAGNVVDTVTAKRLWVHSVGTGMLSVGLARALHVDDEGAFLGGLLHDVGSIAVASELHRLEVSASLELVDAERHALHNRYHVAFGLNVAELWKLPDVVHQVIAHHHIDGAPSESSAVVSAINLADRIAYGLGFGSPALAFDLFEHPALETFGLTREAAMSLFDGVVSNVIGEVQMLQ